MTPSAPRERRRGTDGVSSMDVIVAKLVEAAKTPTSGSGREARAALKEAVARGEAFGSARDVDRSAHSIRRLLASEGGCVDAFGVLMTVSSVRTGWKTSSALEEAVGACAERIAAKTPEDDEGHARLGFEALRFYVRPPGWSQLAVERAKRVVRRLDLAVQFAMKLVLAAEDAEEEKTEETLQAALLLISVVDVCGVKEFERVCGSSWPSVVEKILSTAQIPMETLIGPGGKYMSAAAVRKMARSELKLFADVVAKIKADRLAQRKSSDLDMKTEGDSPHSVSTFHEEEEQPLAEASSPETSVSQAAQKNSEAVFATRRHFDLDVSSTASEEPSVSDLFHYQIDAMCAYSEEFNDTIQSAIRWIRRCRATLRRTTLLKTSTISRGLEHALRASLDSNLASLHKISRLAKMVGVRKFLTANEDKTLITPQNIDAWVTTGFRLVRIAARSDASLAPIAIMALVSISTASKNASAISLQVSFTRWCRTVHARRADAKAELMALVHYEHNLMSKALAALREYAPYHRETTNRLVVEFGLRWRDNARLLSEKVAQLPDSYEDGEEGTTQSPLRGNSTTYSHSWRPESLIRASKSFGPRSSRARSRRTRSVTSHSSQGTHDMELDPPVAMTDEQRVLFDAFHAWVDFTYDSLTSGSNLRAIQHRNRTLVRKAFIAMRRYVLRSVGVREKAVTIEAATQKLDFYISGGAAFRKWRAGVQYIKRLYAYVDEEVKRWEIELRANCFRAWREVAASGARSTMWEEQMLADVKPALDKYRSAVWLKRWVEATQISTEERLDMARKEWLRRLLRAWKTRSTQLIVRRLVAECVVKLEATL